MPRSNSFRSVTVKILIWGTILVCLVCVLSAVGGYAYAGVRGLAAGLIGGGIALVFFGITSLVMFITSTSSPLTMAAVLLGSFLLKMVIFLALVVAIRGKDFYDPYVLLIAMMAGAITSLAVDIVVTLRSRIPIADDNKPQIRVRVFGARPRGW